MGLYNVTVEEAMWNTKLIEANSPQEARDKMEAIIDAALTPNGDDTEFDDLGDWLYEGDSDTFIHRVSWVENGETCDDDTERISRWWRDARIAKSVAAGFFDTGRQPYLPGMPQEIAYLVFDFYYRLVNRQDARDLDQIDHRLD